MPSDQTATNSLAEIFSLCNIFVKVSPPTVER